MIVLGNLRERDTHTHTHTEVSIHVVLIPHQECLGTLDGKNQRERKEGRSMVIIPTYICSRALLHISICRVYLFYSPLPQTGLHYVRVLSCKLQVHVMVWFGFGSVTWPDLTWQTTTMLTGKKKSNLFVSSHFFSFLEGQLFLPQVTRPTYCTYHIVSYRINQGWQIL